MIYIKNLYYFIFYYYKDGNSFYRAVGLQILMNCLLDLKNIKNIEKSSYLYKLIRKIEENTSLKLLHCCGNYNLDLEIRELLKKRNLMSQILMKFFCLFIHQNFEIQDEKEKIDQDLAQKVKLIKFVIDTINDYPIFDMVMVIFMRTYLIYDSIKKEEKDISKINFFGKEPPLSFLEQLCVKNKIGLTLIDIKSDDIVKKFNYQNPEIQYVKMGLCYLDDSFSLLYSKEEANRLFDYDNLEEKCDGIKII